jgi:hypothetical protein
MKTYKHISITLFCLLLIGIKCIRVPFRDAYGFGGGIHCMTSDLRRHGDRVNYFPNLDNGGL